MPEGHLIHHIARRLRAELAGRVVASTSPQGPFADGAGAVDGRLLEDVEAYGKHLFHRFGDRVVHVHLGRQGAFPWLPAPAPEPRPQVRWRLAAEPGAADLIAPLVCELGPAALRDDVVGRLGPDPLRPDADVATVVRRIAADRRAIGAVLLDQEVVSGVGNVLRSEALFLLGIDPATPALALGPAAAERLWGTLVEVMERAAALGRIVTVDDGDVPEGEARFVYRQSLPPLRRVDRAAGDRRPADVPVPGGAARGWRARLRRDPRSQPGPPHADRPGSSESSPRFVGEGLG